MGALTINIVKGLTIFLNYIVLLFRRAGLVKESHLVETVSHPQNPNKESHLLEVQFFLHVLCFLIFKLRSRFEGIIDGLLTKT